MKNYQRYLYGFSGLSTLIYSLAASSTPAMADASLDVAAAAAKDQSDTGHKTCRMTADSKI